MSKQCKMIFYDRKTRSKCDCGTKMKLQLNTEEDFATELTPEEVGEKSVYWCPKCGMIRIVFHGYESDFIYAIYEASITKGVTIHHEY